MGDDRPDDGPRPGDKTEVLTSAMRAFVRSFVAYRHGIEFGVGKVVTISPDGVFVASDQLFSVGSVLELKFSMPFRDSAPMLELTGEVLEVRTGPAGRRDTTGMHLGFLDLEGPTKELIERYVRLQRPGVVEEADSGEDLPAWRKDPELEDRYEDLEAIGAGGTGEVFRAFDRALGEWVALKVLKQSLSGDETARKRLRREIRLSRMIRSEHVASVYDLAQYGDRDVFVMEYIPGESVHDLIHRVGAVDEDRAIDIGIDALAGLAAAHHVGVVHRDLKPSNLVLTDGGRAVVVDFGFATMPGDPRYTPEKEIIGTAAFISPEMVLGGQVDAPADLYGLACVLFNLLTGEPPFGLGQPMQLAYKHAHDDPPRARDRVPAVSEALSDLLFRAMAKEPADRPASAGDMAEALRRIRSGDRGDASGAPTRVVLVAEPDEIMCRRLERSLPEEGFEIRRLGDGYQLVEMALKGDADAIFVDLDVQIIDGQEVAQILRSMPQTAAIPIALVSDKPDLQDLAGFMTGTLPLAKSADDATLHALLTEMSLSVP